MPYIHSFKRKLRVGAITSLWLVAFLVFIAPFDASDLSFSIRMEIMIVYGLILFVCYAIVSIIESLFFLKFQNWSVSNEFGSYTLLYILVFPPTVLYYKSDIVNGDYSELNFFLEQYIPILIIITPVLFFLRKLASNSNKDELVILKGENKRDVLRLQVGELVCISSSDNYVEVSFLENGKIHKKLLRTTLKKVESDFSFLKRVHRSHLINPSHFVEWKNRDAIVLAGIIVPVTKQYHKNIPG